MRARLESVFFGSGQYPRLARVLALTARRFCPDWDVNVREIQPHAFRAASGSESAAANHYKLAEWARLVAEAPDGARLLLVDADTFVTAPLDPLWNLPFDVAYTARNAARYPLNAGVIAVRVSPGTREWMAAWLARDRVFLDDVNALRPWRQEYGGQNQASLGSILESDLAERLGLTIAPVPCLEWNAEDTCWERFSERTRIVHVKSALRLDAFSMASFAKTRALAKMWRALDAEAAA